MSPPLKKNHAKDTEEGSISIAKLLGMVIKPVLKFHWMKSRGFRMQNQQFPKNPLVGA